MGTCNTPKNIDIDKRTKYRMLEEKSDLLTTWSVRGFFHISKMKERP